MTRRQHTCPICGASGLPSWERYPRYVCGACVGRACDERGRRLEFFNEGPFGGFLSVYADTRERYGQRRCYIDGRACEADEARFGGIVIQLLE